MSPLAPSVIVFEKSPRWESELKRRLGGCRLLVRPCRSAPDVVSLSRLAPGSVVVIDVNSVEIEGWRLLGDLAQRRIPAFRIAIGPRETRNLEWLARELGAAGFFADAVTGEALADLCCRVISASTATRPGAPARG
jgi:hypothetical protein